MAVLIVQGRRRPEAKEAGRQRLLILQMLGDKGTVSDDDFEREKRIQEAGNESAGIERGCGVNLTLRRDSEPHPGVGRGRGSFKDFDTVAAIGKLGRPAQTLSSGCGRLSIWGP